MARAETLCVEEPAQADSASPLAAQFRQALQDLAFANLQVDLLSRCDDTNGLRIRGLSIKKKQDDIEISGEMYRRGAVKGDLKTSMCKGCHTSKDGVDRALGYFLNDTLFNWNWRLLGAFHIESCSRQRHAVFTKLRLAEKSSVKTLESVSYGVAEVYRLNNKELLMPSAIYLDLDTPASIAGEQPFDAKFRWRNEYTEYELIGFAAEYCTSPAGKNNRLLVPVYLVNLDYINGVEENLRNPDRSAAGYLWSSSTLSPSRSGQK